MPFISIYTRFEQIDFKRKARCIIAAYSLQ